MTIQELKDIALHAAKGTVPACFANENIDVNAAFVDGLRELAGSVNQFMKNRYDIYEILVETIDQVVPNKVSNALAPFAEVRQVPQGVKAIFRQPVGRERAKKFLTRAALSGVYETFRLDSTNFEVGVNAVGIGATIDFERMLDGVESLAECMDVIAEAIADGVFMEVHKALRAALSAADRPDANKVSGSWDADSMVKLMNVVRAYGAGVTIFAPPEFIAAMGPDAIVPVGTYGSSYPAVGVYPTDDIEKIHNTGFISVFRGAPIVQIPQSFVDTNNKKTWIDPQMAYILPTGKEKVVKVVLEGATQIHDYTNRDNSIEIYAYKKMGCAVITNYNWGIYQNTGITQTYEE